jgi:hypothetical protein
MTRTCRTPRPISSSCRRSACTGCLSERAFPPRCAALDSALVSSPNFSDVTATLVDVVAPRSRQIWELDAAAATPTPYWGVIGQSSLHAGGPVCRPEVPAGLCLHTAGAVRRSEIALPVSAALAVDCMCAEPCLPDGAPTALSSPLVLTWSCNVPCCVHCRMQLFDKVDGKVTPGRGRKRILDFYLKTSTYPEIKSFTVNGSTLLPPEVLPPPSDRQYTIVRQCIKHCTATSMLTLQSSAWYEVTSAGRKLAAKLASNRSTSM